MDINKLKILVINLKNRPIRLANCLRELYKCFNKNQIKIFEAINKEYAKKNMHKYISEDAYNNIVKKLKSTLILPTWGSVGCAISHTKCWDYIIENNLDNALIIEDDIEITNISSFKFNLYHMLSVHNKCNYDGELPIANYMGYTRSFIDKSYPLLTLFNANSSQIYSPDTKYYQINNKFTGTHAYIINRNCCKYLKNKIFPLKYQIDIQLSYFTTLYINKIYIFNFYNSGINQTKKFKSDVQYYFIKKKDLINNFRNLPIDIVKIIYNYLPNINNLYNINLFYSTYLNYDYDTY